MFGSLIILLSYNENGVDNMMLRERQYISIGKVAKLLGVSVVTIRRWEKLGKINCCFRTVGSHRRYDIYKIREQFLKENNNKTLCYARVSSHYFRKEKRII